MRSRRVNRYPSMALAVLVLMPASIDLCCASPAVQQKTKRAKAAKANKSGPERYGLKMVKLGMTKEQVDEWFLKHCYYFHDDNEPLDIICGAPPEHLRLTAAGFKPERQYFWFCKTGGRYRLYKIVCDFPEEDFSEIADALKAKYGPPKLVTEEVVGNAMGAKFSAQDMTWDNRVSKIKLYQRTDQLNTCRLVFDETALSYSVQQARKKAPNLRAEDL